jgi:hypothetical protein
MPGAQPRYVAPYLQNLYPDEVHGLEGHCINPKCDYVFTAQDQEEMQSNSGWFTCPKCDHTYNYLDPSYNGTPGGYTRSGLTATQMGEIGEKIIENLHSIPGVGEITENHAAYNFPVDFNIGPYAVEVKTNHSESQPRFKLGGGAERAAKIQWAQQRGLIPALIGVRLNFYTDKADIFFRPQLSDTWIGSPDLRHVASVDFSNLNPFKNPHQVPPPNDLPVDDSTSPPSDSDIPF